MEKNKKVKPLLYYFSKCLSNKTLRSLIKYIVNKKCGTYAIDLPDDLSASKNILFILPEDPIEVLHQIVNIDSIIKYFNSSHRSNIIFLCEKKITPYIDGIQNVKSIIEYEKDERYIFSTKLKLICKKLLKEYIDLCLMLERKPDLSLLYIIGLIQAKVRVTYSNVGEFPFFNLRIKISNEHQYLTDQNCIMAKMLGVKEQADLQWSVTDESLNEIMDLFKKVLIKDVDWLGGIDVQYYFKNFGKKFTETLINTLKSQYKKTWYLYSDSMLDNSNLKWLKEKNIPIFTEFTPSSQAALIKKTNLIISGKTTFFELANLLNKPVIGVFNEDELLRYCRNKDQSIGISYSEKNKDQIIDEICKKVSLFYKSDLVGI